LPVRAIQSRQDGFAKVKKNLWPVPGCDFLHQEPLPALFRVCFSLQVALDTPHVAHGGGTDQQTGHPELASHWQLSSRKGCLRLRTLVQRRHVSYGIFALFLTASSSFRGTRISLGKAKWWYGLRLLGWSAFVCQGQIGTLRSEVGDEAFLPAGALDCLGLTLWQVTFTGWRPH